MHSESKFLIADFLHSLTITISYIGTILGVKYYE